MAKIRIHVLTTYNSPNSLALVYPLLVNKPFFDKEGLKFYFYDKLCDKVYNCDTLFINSKFFRRWHGESRQQLYEVLANFKKRIQKVVWFDTTDSTGTTQFNVMPYVDSYYKSQVLKDRSLYNKPLYGHRIFADYYKEIFGMGDDEELRSSGTGRRRSLSVLLQEEYAHKLKVSWNSAMNEWGGYNYIYGGLMARVRTHSPFKADYKIRFANPDKERPVGILGRIGLSHKIKMVRYQREEIVKMLKEKFNVDVSKIPRRQYLNEIRNSKIGISPFGMGEISCRDFEIIINGAILFKQDMSHLETWPPLYVNDETYIGYSWDLKDFEEKLREILNDNKRIKRISKKAQERYAYYLYGEGMQELRDKVLSIIK